jgi:tetratricopeptide (TPR) repeat protein
MRTRILAATFVAATAAVASGQTSELGRIDFPTSGAPAAQERFVRGVLLLHSFEYDDAAEEFRAAQKAEPGFAMAYWGEAMTKNHPLWMDRDAEGARKILSALGPTREARLAKAPTPREKGYLDAVEALYAEGEKAQRDAAYAEAMRRLHEEFPADLEAQSFYALALLGSCERDRDFAVYMKAAALAEEVFAKNPTHPGAAHYLIHSYDDPVHAPLGLRPARVYARIAPAAAHALHMPSHIFLASGMWDDVVASNEASFAAADARVERRHLSVDERNFHALFWLEYAYLQQGRVADARRLLATMEADAKKSGSNRARSSFGAMRAAYAVETECRADLPATDGREPRDLFVAGYCGWKRGDADAIAAALAGLPADGAGKADGAGSSHANAHGAAMGGYGPGPGVAGVFRMQLEAMRLAVKGDPGAAVARAREAAEAEGRLSFEFGPPVVVKPSRELAGELLLAQKKAPEAQKEFAAALRQAPGRSLSLGGLVTAATTAHDDAAAKEASRRLSENRRRSGTGNRAAGSAATPGDAPR